MSTTSGPVPAALAALQSWAGEKRLPQAGPSRLVLDILSASGCHNANDTALYSVYLNQLLEGRHDTQALNQLSLPALQLAGAVLLAWRDWLQSGAEAPPGIDALLLDCVAAAQSIATPRLISGRDLYDRATGLPDRTALPQALQQAQANTSADRLTALLYIEITIGPHVYPDSLLLAVAKRLGKLLRGHDTLLLINHQTFCLVLANLNGEGHALLAANRAIGSFEEPVDLDGQIICLHPRIGIALSPDHGHTAEQLLNAGATAARENASDGVGIYDPGHDELNFALKRLEAPLRLALQENRFHLVFQPQVYCQGHGLYGMESLLRWQDEELGLVRNDEIVMVAEYLGLMGTLTHWVINASLREFAKLIKAGVPGSISINLAPANLRDREIPSAIKDALAVWQVPADRVVLEITESALIEGLDEALESLHALKKLGCKLALDDFGTGYSSLSYLKQLPIDELKIDRSFVIAMHKSEKDAGIVRTIIGLSHLLGLTVVTEGVEDMQTADMLADMGNDVIQGFCFSKPLPPATIPAFISTLT